jgi:hypothetical protein
MDWASPRLRGALMTKRMWQHLGGMAVDAALAVLLLFGLEEAVALTLVGVGALDCVLIRRKRETISAIVWNKYPQWFDYLLLVGWLLSILIIRGLNPACWYTIGVIYGHWHWNNVPEECDES